MFQAGALVADEVRLTWRHAHASGGQASAWSSDLSLLSGGQRSLVAVALLIAVSMHNEELHLLHTHNQHDIDCVLQYATNTY